ncbi:hypothetical protein [Jonesia quinghaiensis]|uniref:hypothetical protein n=1 Tax=Jonesia quinghaiensis TaxID=262806 RepID=UPI000400E06E|nr:hypothetical protein [Jonesia quinghaiensis]
MKMLRVLRGAGVAAAMLAGFGVGAIAVAGGLGVHRRFGVSPQQASSTLPGDEFVPHPTHQGDRGIVVDASPDRVWPWVAQLGQAKAGFYSWEALENAVGCDIHGTSIINPVWQQVVVGEEFKLHPDMALRVVSCEPGKHLVVSTQGASAPQDMAFDMVWSFVLIPEVGGGGHEKTFLHVRERYSARSRGAHLMVSATLYVSAAMTWKMLRTIARYARS